MVFALPVCDGHGPSTYAMAVILRNSSRLREVEIA